MIDQNIIKLTKDRNPEERKRAVKLLAQTANTESLPYLADLYKNDPDAEVRELALKAGRYIKKQTGTLPNMTTGEYMAVSASDSPSNAREFSYKYGDEEDERMHTASPDSPENKARAMMEEAIRFFENNDDKRAQIKARNAFAEFPDFKHDHYYMDWLAKIFDVPQEEALRTLVEFMKTGKHPKKKHKEKDLDDTTFGEMIVDYGIIAFSVMVSTVVLNLAVITMLRPDIQELYNVLGSSAFQSPRIANMVQVLSALVNLDPSATFLSQLGQGLSAGISTLISLTIYLYFLNMVSNALSSGRGTFNGLVKVLTMPMVILNSLSYVAMIFLTVNVARVAFQEVIQGVQSNTQAVTTGFDESVVTASAWPLAILAVLFVVQIGFYIRGIMKNYKLGIFSATAAFVMSFFAIICAACALSFVLGLLISM
jgi:hypothetical protein